MPKTEAGVRNIPLIDPVYEALQNEYDRQKRDGFCTVELDGMTGFIFSNKLGSLHNPLVYGEMVHTAFTDSEHYKNMYDNMKQDLQEFLDKDTSVSEAEEFYERFTEKYI